MRLCDPSIWRERTTLVEEAPIVWVPKSLMPRAFPSKSTRKTSRVGRSISVSKLVKANDFPNFVSTKP